MTRSSTRCAVCDHSGACTCERRGAESPSLPECGVTRARTGNAVRVTTNCPRADGLLGGRYVLHEVLGIGSSAVVHRAEDVRTGQAVAVKLFSSAGSPADLRRRRREIDALTRLEHPGLVRLLDGDPTGPRPFVVTELVEGPTLAQALAVGPWDAGRVRRLGAMLAAALAVVHAGGFVHRDVKPANVLLDGAGRPRLADFGIAWTQDGATATTAGAVVGTAAYMSPEQVGGREVGPATDVYALGLVLIEASTGRREYPGSAVESAVARLSRPPRVPGGLPATLSAAVEAMTRTDPARRPGAAEVARMLSDTAISTVRRAAPATGAGSSRSRRALLVAATSVLGPLLVLGAVGPAGTAWVPIPPSAGPAAPARQAASPPGSAATTSGAGRQDVAALVAVPSPAEQAGVTVAPDPPHTVGAAARPVDEPSVAGPVVRSVGDGDAPRTGPDEDDRVADRRDDEVAARPENGGGPDRGRGRGQGPPEHARN
ncbi:serine/threonine-protein kinase [Pseudonocardia hydrocarbonoxydans]